jgi:hypothetical protein
MHFDIYIFICSDQQNQQNEINQLEQQQQPPWKNAQQLNQFYIDQLLFRTSIDSDCCSIISEYLTCDRLSEGDDCWFLTVENEWKLLPVKQITNDEMVKFVLTFV